MLFGLFGKKKSRGSADPWRFKTLRDYWEVIHFLEQHRKTGNEAKAMQKFFFQTHQLYLRNIDRYVELIDQLDEVSDGIYSDPEIAKHCGLKLAEGMTLKGNVQKQAKAVREFLNKIDEKEGDDFRLAWERVIDNTNAYIKFLSKLVQDMGNFEVLIVQLPGMNFPENPRVQSILHEMFEINTRHIRILELISDVRADWRKGNPSTGFFEPGADFGTMVKTMLLEYMRESDPKRIAAKQARAKKTGRPFSKYRFWRPAETVRQMADIEYGPPPQRIPKPRRPYVDLRVKGKIPMTCADMKRLEWSIKEVFNNSIAATSIMNKTKAGLVASPLEKHEGLNKPVINVSVKTFKKKVGLFKKENWVRLVIADDGVGMESVVCENAHLWAYSTRRAEFGKNKASGAKALIIGGKGIGLAFATALIKQHGGELTVSSKEDVGTEVVFEVPAPSPHTIGLEEF